MAPPDDTFGIAHGISDDNVKHSKDRKVACKSRREPFTFEISELSTDYRDMFFLYRIFTYKIYSQKISLRKYLSSDFYLSAHFFRK